MSQIKTVCLSAFDKCAVIASGFSHLLCFRSSLAVVENSAETDSVLTYPESVLTLPNLRDLRDLHRAASFGNARRISVTVVGHSSSRRLDLALSADCVALYRAVAAAFAVPPRSFRLLRRCAGDWCTVVDDAGLRTALEQAMQLQPPQISLRKEPAASPSGEPSGRE